MIFGIPLALPLFAPAPGTTACGREREIVLLDPGSTRIHAVQMVLAPERAR